MVIKSFGRQVDCRLNNLLKWSKMLIYRCINTLPRMCGVGAY